MNDLGTKDFTFDFALDAKSVDDSLTVLDDGDLLIEGVGLNFEVDREDEAFEDSQFLQKSLDKFVANGGPLCFHHKQDHVLGQVLEAKVIPGKGVHLKARVDHQPESSPLRHLYEQIKKGTIRGLSAAGRFRRRMTPQGPRIYDADFVEWSATATPVGFGTGFAVVGTKALEDIKIPEGIELPEVDGEIRSEDEETIKFAVEALESVFTRIGQRKKDKPPVDFE